MIAALIVLVTVGVSDIQVKRVGVDPAIATRRAAYVEGRPALRGFRAGMLADASVDWPIVEPDAAHDARLAAAADIVAKRLSRDGLLPTLVRVVDALGATEFKDEDRLELLRETGLPVDWLTYFTHSSSRSVVQFVSQRLISGSKADGVIADLGQVAFAFRPTIPGFQVATESGETDAECIRLQVGSGAYYTGEGDGGTVDVPRELSTRIENASFVVGIQDQHVDPFVALAGTWKLAAGSTLTLVPQALPVSQWAQDNGKAGVVAAERARTTATLVPRYASRGEDGASFVPGDTFALEAFASLGRAVAQSPLLFQGGNLIPVLDPKTHEREMIVGEAELFRNMTLGLTRAQVLEALRIEFGVARSIVLPASSFHVDYEVSIRSTPDGLVAFMNDTSAAARLVVQCAIPALERSGVLGKEDAAAVRKDIAENKWPVVLEGLVTVLSSKAVGYGAFPESFAKNFAVSPVDSGVGNLQRLLLAFDVLTAESSDAAALAKLDLDPHLVAYLTSFRRREVERQLVAQALAREGMRIVGVPSTSEGGRSLNVLNGVHLRGVYYMPAYGGLFADFDLAAQKVFETTLGPSVHVVPIHCGESMRRQGALHCSMSIVPRL